MCSPKNKTSAQDLHLCLFAGHGVAMASGWILFMPHRRILNSSFGFFLVLFALYMVDHWTTLETLGRKRLFGPAGMKMRLMIFSAGVLTMAGAIGCLLAGWTNFGIGVFFLSTFLPPIFSPLAPPER